MNTYYVYILASRRNGTLYIGVTNNLLRRTGQHKASEIPGFTKRYRVHLLVHYEVFSHIETAIRREKCLKKWNRQWKLRLIEQTNPQWCDLYDEFMR